MHLRDYSNSGLRRILSRYNEATARSFRYFRDRERRKGGTRGNASWELIARGFRFEEHEKNVPGIF
jgi:hypothetical protein